MVSYLNREDEIMEQEALVKKLRYKTGRAVVLNAPEGFRLGIGEEASASREALYDFVLLFVRDSGQVRERLPSAISLLKPDTVFWIAYPKMSAKTKTDINRDTLWPIVHELSGYRPVSNVAIDETWSALRLRHQDQVKSK